MLTERIATNYRVGECDLTHNISTDFSFKTMNS